MEEVKGGVDLGVAEFGRGKNRERDSLSLPMSGQSTPLLTSNDYSPVQEVTKGSRRDEDSCYSVRDQPTAAPVLSCGDLQAMDGIVAGAQQENDYGKSLPGHTNAAGATLVEGSNVEDIANGARDKNRHALSLEQTDAVSIRSKDNFSPIDDLGKRPERAENSRFRFCTQTTSSPVLTDDDRMEGIVNDAWNDSDTRTILHGYAKSLYRHRQTDGDTLNSTTSLYEPSIIYVMENGRRYCGDYFMPNDEDEQSRLQMLHSLRVDIMDGQLTTVPLVNPTMILDIGTGTAEWALEMGEAYPEAEIIGTDIAKIQPSAAPLNVFFEIDDAEDEAGWTWPEDHFDLVHLGSMSGAFKDWKYIYGEAFRHLKPGGWLEVVDLENRRHLAASYFPEDSGVMRLAKAVQEASAISGRKHSNEHLDEQILLDMGYVEVEIKYFELPFGMWREDDEGFAIGKLSLATQLYSIEAMGLRLITRHMGWHPDEVRRICKLASDEIKSLALDLDRCRGLNIRFMVLVGRKAAAATSCVSASVTEGPLSPPLSLL